MFPLCFFLWDCYGLVELAQPKSGHGVVDQGIPGAGGFAGEPRGPGVGPTAPWPRWVFLLGTSSWYLFGLRKNK